MVRIREARERLGMKQKDLAMQLGISRPNLSRYETGEREPDSEILIKIASILNCSIDYLYGNIDDPTPLNKKKEAPATFEEVEEAYIKMLAAEKGVSIEDLVLSDDDKKELRGAILAMIKGYGK